MKAILVGDSETAAGVAPMPVNATVCGEPVALVAICTEAVSDPGDAGVKATWKVQLEPAESVDLQV